MYQDILLQCSKDTRFKVAALDAAGVARRNPACGDEVELGVSVDETGRVRVRYRAQACAITLASAAVLAEAVTGCVPEAAEVRLREALAYFAGDADWTGDWAAREMRALGEVRAFPMRMACVRLPWEAFGCTRIFGAERGFEQKGRKETKGCGAERGEPRINTDGHR